MTNRTQTLNCCSNATADEIVQVLTNLIPKRSGGEGQSFIENGLILQSLLVSALVELRDNHAHLVEWKAFKDILTLEKVMMLSDDMQLTEKLREQLKLLVSSIPGVDMNKKGLEQSQLTQNQFDYIASEMRESLESLLPS